MPKEEITNSEEAAGKIFSYLGFARRSGNVRIGTNLVLSEVRGASLGGRADKIAVLMSENCSERTKKQVCGKCGFYKVFCRISPLDSERLSKALGKSAPVSAVAITDKNLASAIKKLYPND